MLQWHALDAAAGIEHEHRVDRGGIADHRIDPLQHTAVAKLEVGGREAAERAVAVGDQHIDADCVNLDAEAFRWLLEQARESHDGHELHFRASVRSGSHRSSIAGACSLQYSTHGSRSGEGSCRSRWLTRTCRASAVRPPCSNASLSAIAAARDLG
jgi:hypothetical protein